ncbi:protein neuralized-like isoform X2 [Thalassophryne amazonica]|uniref:protein neuralized-like isoform X2 n=1 Tax=Thalassophryne amazonica TaxID=390379 RepID=UPI001471D464|nr:protein neuralized-like isoform X2 [Thalassophryne amazonica]
MVKQRDNNRNSESTHRCGVSCLGPLSFHNQAVGDMIRLSMGDRFAERSNENFKDGLVFSSRPLKVQEKVRLRVQNVLENWSGSLRVGFTNVPPTSRTLPLPNMAIPVLTNTPGHWAAPVSAVHCGPGSELEFWVSAGGSLYFTSNKSSQQELLTGVDLSKPLWAMIDIYGQTCSVFLLGSEKKEKFHSRKSCPVPEYLAPPDVDKDKHVSLPVQETPSERTHRCGVSCLGPLSFHTQAVGDMIRLSMGDRFAERSNKNFKDGLVFSSRPLKIQEKVRLRVQNVLQNWHGSLCVGFTNVPPTSRTLPLPNMAIPKLTNTPGHWAAAINAVHCGPGTELKFWVSSGGSLYFTSNKSSQQELLTGVDLSKPLWAMIDIYGQTCSVFLLGSEKKEIFHTRKSCPVPEYLARPDVDKDKHVPLHVQETPSDAEMDPEVCMAEEATVTLNCEVKHDEPLSTSPDPEVDPEVCMAEEATVTLNCEVQSDEPLSTSPGTLQ